MIHGSIPSSGRASRAASLLLVPALLAAPLALAGCGRGQVQLPPARPIIVHSGERLHVDADSMKVVHEWLTKTLDVIDQDPSFWIISDPSTRAAYPWQAVTVVTPDSVRVEYERTHPDAQTSLMVYAFLHIMARRDSLSAFLPGAPAGGDTFQVERAILDQVAQTWVLGRSVFSTGPYEPLDELMYAAREGWLDAFILTSRPDDFADARAAWEQAHPGRMEAYQDWFRKTFNRAPPGSRPQAP